MTTRAAAEGVAKRLAELAAVLQSIRDQPANTPDGSLCDPGLYPMLESLKVTIDFLDGFQPFRGPGRGAGLTRPLYDLMLALHDLERGHVHPVLRTKITGKRGSATHYQAVTAWAAIYMDTLKIAGNNNKEASDTAASELSTRRFELWCSSERGSRKNGQWVEECAEHRARRTVSSSRMG